MSKYFAYQVDPEYQESPLWQFYPESFEFVSVFGNRYEREIISSDIALIMKVLKNDTFIFDFEDSENNQVRKDVLNYWFDGDLPEISDEQMIQLSDFIGMEDPNMIAAVFSILTGKQYVWYQIKGSCQREWNYIYWCKTDHPHFDHLAFECEYYNEGSEWLCRDRPIECEHPIAYEEFVYTHGWLDRDIREEIAREIGVEPSDIVLFEFTGYKRFPEYKEIVFD